MKLVVKVVEARDLCARDPNGFSDPFVRLALGSTKVKTSVVYKNLNPSWNEEFFFNVTNLDEELKVTVWDSDLFTSDFLGQIVISVDDVLNSDKQKLPRSWFRLEKRSEKSKVDVSGEIMLEISLFGRSVKSEEERPSATQVAVTAPLRMSSSPNPRSATPVSDVILDNQESSSVNEISSGLSDVSDHPELEGESLLAPESPSQDDGGTVLNLDSPIVKEFHEVEKKKMNHGHAFADKLSAVFHKKGRKQHNSSMSSVSPTSSRRSDVSAETLFGSESSGVGEHPQAGTEGSESGDDDEEVVPLSFWQDDSKSVGQSDEELPAPLSGVLVDQSFAVSMKALNGILFKPGSEFAKELAEVQKTTELVEEPWKKVGNEPMKRLITYRKAPTKLIKAVVASEVQTYLRADDKAFAIFCSVSTPDVPYGKSFLCEMIFLITPGPQIAEGTSTCRLNISWRMNFLQSTMMKGMINNGAAQGLKDTYSSHQQVLAKYATPLDGQGSSPSSTAELVAGRPKTNWELAREYFGNYTVLLTFVGLIFIIVHIFLVKTKGGRGLEVWKFDLPDSFGEVVTVAFLFRQVERVGLMVQKFLAARCKASDHGKKAQGDGWLLTITLVGAENLYSIDADGSCDAYVVFTCNGKIRTSSVRLGSFNPQWDEVYEFDATEDPPSTMDIEVFDYDGPFSTAESLGQAMINFLKTKADAYADVWLPLSGNIARSHDAKLHLRVVLTNTRSENLQPKKYREKVQEAARTKIVPRSLQRNSQFQKLFSLPQEEFLINDYACAIKRKIPIQGRLFLSPRMVGFYSNLFGHKTKFSFLWEDIEDVKESPPSRGALFNPSVTVILRKGQGQDAEHGSKGHDQHGRLRFQFLSFVRPGPAFRTIVALWKNRTATVEQTMELIASVEAEDMKSSVAEKQAEDSLAFVGLEDTKMTFLVEVQLPATVKQLGQLFEYGALDHQVMEMFSVSDYKSTHWETVGDDKSKKRRQVSYLMSRQQCNFGSKVTTIQQRTLGSDFKSAQLEELMTLHDVPFGDHFQVQVRKDVSTVSEGPGLVEVKVYCGLAWNKEASMRRKITKGTLKYMSDFLTEYMQFAIQIIESSPPQALEPLAPEKDTATNRGLPQILERLIKPSGRPSFG